METRCVPFKLVVEGQEIEAYLTEKNWELVLKAINKNKKTGYERVAKEDIYFWDDSIGVNETCAGWECDKEMYDAANYYSDREVAENNARADKLMRQLRRFAVEHRENKKIREKYYIYYLKESGLLQLRRDDVNHFISPWFDTLNAGAKAIETFKDELIWYFTEYKDGL